VPFQMIYYLPTFLWEYILVLVESQCSCTFAQDDHYIPEVDSTHCRF
jgi:hypothetical protein